MVNRGEMMVRIRVIVVVFDMNMERKKVIVMMFSVRLFG